MIIRSDLSWVSGVLCSSCVSVCWCICRDGVFVELASVLTVCLAQTGVCGFIFHITLSACVATGTVRPPRRLPDIWKSKNDSPRRLDHFLLF